MTTKDELEMYRHTNQVQAQRIKDLEAELNHETLQKSRAETELLIARQKHRGLLKEFRAFKDLIRHLGSAATDIEWQDHESERS